MKRFLCIILSALLLVSVLPVGVVAENTWTVTATAGASDVDKLFDGDYTDSDTTRWSSGGGIGSGQTYTSVSITIGFGESTDVHSLNLYSGTDYAVAYTVYVSDTGTDGSWTVAASSDSGTATNGCQTIDLGTATGSFLKIECTQSVEGWHYWSIYELEVIGHDYELTATVPATCSTPGSETYTCSICNSTYSVELQMLEHTPGTAQVENEVAATETTDGSYDLVIRCTECGSIISSEHYTVPATGTQTGTSGREVPPLMLIQASYTAVDNAIAKAEALNPDDYVSFDEVTAAVNAVVRDLSALNQASVNAYAEAIETAIENLVPISTVTEEAVEIIDPVEPALTDTEDDSF